MLTGAVTALTSGWRRKTSSTCVYIHTHVIYITRFIYIHTSVCIPTGGWMHSSFRSVVHLLHSLIAVVFHLNLSPSLLLCPCFSTSFSWSSHLSPSVPSLVRFDIFHLLPNPYFYFSPCPVITFLKSLHFFLCYPPSLSPAFHRLLSFMLSACFVCECIVCVCACVCVRVYFSQGVVRYCSAPSLPTVCPINISRHKVGNWRNVRAQLFFKCV